MLAVILTPHIMTLCLAWKKDKNLNLMSDSRLTGEEGTITDNANKVFTIKISAYKKTDTESQLVFDSAYGMCFAGSYLNGSNLADTISELTSNINIYNDERINFARISEIAFILYEYISKHLMEINREKGFSEVFFTGYCPELKVNKLSKFFSRLEEDGSIKFYSENVEIEDNQFAYLGDESAIVLAESLIGKIKYPYSEFHLLDEIIKDTNISTVGGCIQYGCIVADKFRTYGIVDHELYIPQNNTETYIENFRVTDKFNFRSIPFNWEDSKLSKLKISLGKVFMAPFIDRKKLVQEESDKQNQQIHNT